MSPSVASYSASRDALVAELRKDAAAHRAGAYDEIGRRFDAVERHFPHGTAPELGRLHIALTFWDAWIDARNYGSGNLTITTNGDVTGDKFDAIYAVNSGFDKRIARTRRIDPHCEIPIRKNFKHRTSARYIYRQVIQRGGLKFEARIFTKP